VLPRTGAAIRLGITGTAGAGKSTLIDALGLMLVAAGRRVAVLAVDPSSTLTGGSILGDKTRMDRLAVEGAAFIRPSPSSGTLGGVAARTREAMLLCEAAGFDVVIVETIGIGQSETVAADLVDCLVVLTIAGAGDELQGIKKGLLERADLIAVSKNDEDGGRRAAATAAELTSALAILAPMERRAAPPVLTVSGLTGAGVDTLWAGVEAHQAAMRASGALSARRSAQQVRWLHVLIEERLTARLRCDAALQERLRELETEVASGRLPPLVAAQDIAERLGA